MPPNDPRFLSMAEHDILFDSLVIRFHRRWVDGSAALEDFAEDTEAQKRMVASGKEVAKDPRVAHLLRLMDGGGRTDGLDPPAPPKRIRVSRGARTEPEKE